MKVIGKHKVSNLSVSDPRVSNLFAQGEKASILYVDPPWGEGNMKFWTTLMKKQTGVSVEPIPFTALIDSILRLALSYTHGMVFIETGLKWEAQIADAMRAAGLGGVRSHHLVYRSGSVMKPCVFLSGATPSSNHSGYAPHPSLSGAALVDDVVQHHAVPEGILLDPCCGMGYSARAATNNGMRFFGNELNASRLAKTIKILER